ncbi:hypothetical protein [Corynebacterium efficiens YS-314]|uniref:Uncharacterized protein n=1 Tax=Corynebacterium efficiens (strain DSM 44549 / YS-314 / AJ 12310 / JCM 11189 / NBRC 100395) TaxID=196164 RepID=Q8FMF1_COREF|nr:hypothetical protein [Corynebacterium efficiens YS-314]
MVLVGAVRQTGSDPPLGTTGDIDGLDATLLQIFTDLRGTTPQLADEIDVPIQIELTHPGGELAHRDVDGILRTDLGEFIGFPDIDQLCVRRNLGDVDFLHGVAPR